MTLWNEPNAPERAGWPTLVMGLLLAVSAWGLTLLAVLLALASITAAFVPAMETGRRPDAADDSRGRPDSGRAAPAGRSSQPAGFLLPALPRFSLPQPSTAQVWPLLFAAWLLLLALGQALRQSETLTLLLLPFVNAAAAAAGRSHPADGPARPAVARAAPRLESLWRQRLLGPALSIFFELLAFLVFGLLFFAYVHAVPALETPFRLLMDELRSENGSPDFAARQIAVLLLSPGGWLLLLGLFALAVPLIEEAFKVTLLGFYAGRMRSRRRVSSAAFCAARLLPWRKTSVFQAQARRTGWSTS